MSDEARKVAIPTLGAVLIAAWFFGLDSAIIKTLLGLFSATIGFPMIAAGLRTLKNGL